jgi:hypothetical protein
MISSAALTLLVVPVFYLALDDAVEWLRRRLARGSKEQAPHAVPAG